MLGFRFGRCRPAENQEKDAERDKKRAAGRIRVVLLPRNGEPEHGVELPEDDVRRALDELIAG